MTDASGMVSSWRDFAAHVKTTPPQFERAAAAAFQGLVAAARTTVAPLGDIPDNVSDSIKHVAYLAGCFDEVCEAPLEEAKMTWNQFAAYVDNQRLADELYAEYTLARRQMYDDLDVTFRTLLPFYLRCAGPTPADYRDEDDHEWMTDLVISYHESGESQEDKREQDAQAEADDQDPEHQF